MTLDSLPILDISQLDGGPEAAASFRTQLREVTHDVGFFYLVGHGIPQELIDEVLDLSRKFFALPQAPQQYKQLLMVAGFDRYFQIAPCFRDEDPRADRLPGEFYQLDLEMSFVTQEDVWNTTQPVITSIFEQFAEGKRVTKDWPRIPYDTAIRKYGSDKPDLRNPIEMSAVTEHFAGSGFKVFANQIDADSKVEVWAIPAKNKAGADPIGRAFCDRMNAWAGRGPAGPGLHLLQGWAGFWPDRQEHR